MPRSDHVRTLRSFLADEWVSGAEPHTELHNAATGAPCARVSTRGLDLARALDHARRVGGPTLRGWTFAERGALLKQMSEVIHGSRDELIALAQENSGNTRSDAKFDIDGASGTLAVYAALGRRLGERRWLLDGPPEKILRSARFVGQHVLTARTGVALHVNAFNFPAWNLCEKAATALLAGMPVLSKPATATALVAVRLVELWHEAGILPAGTVSLLAGGAGDLLDHVGPQDVVAFTGSGETGRALRSHPAVLRHGVPVNVEADSLNAAVLGPDVAPGTETFQMFVEDVARDLTQKAGQKCTAIRRVLVPEALAGEAADALADRLSSHRTGDPTDRATTVGPLATRRQQEDVAAGIARLAEVLPRVWGDPGAVPEDGYFVAPQLFRSDAGLDAPLVHDHEIFGPVATLLTWSGEPAGAVALVARGGGSLVTSVYSDDLSWSGEVLLGLAPWNGRIVWGSRRVWDQSPGPGTVLANLVHGGPGRAGGGEELGLERGMRLYQQRTAIQGDRALVERVFGKIEE